MYSTIIHIPVSTEFEVLVRQLAMKDITSNRWTSHLRKVLYQNKLPSPIQLANNPPKKEAWKSTVKRVIRDHSDQSLKEDAVNMKSLKFLNLDICSIRYSHPVWICRTDLLQAIMAMTIAVLLVYVNLRYWTVLL